MHSIERLRDIRNLEMMLNMMPGELCDSEERPTPKFIAEPKGEATGYVEYNLKTHEITSYDGKPASK